MGEPTWRATQRKKQKAERLRCRKAGFCIDCYAASVKHYRCRKCADRVNESRRRSRERVRAFLAAHGYDARTGAASVVGG